MATEDRSWVHWSAEVHSCSLPTMLTTSLRACTERKALRWITIKQIVCTKTDFILNLHQFLASGSVRLYCDNPIQVSGSSHPRILSSD